VVHLQLSSDDPFRTHTPILFTKEIMASDSVANVGLTTSSSQSTSLAIFTPRSAIERIKELLQSQQFQDGVRLFAIGAAVSASKSIADSILAAAKRFLFASATFRGRDEAYRWMMLYMTTHPNFQNSPRDVEVSARPSLLVDYEASSRGLLSEGEIQATWTDVQGTDTDEKIVERREKQESEEEEQQAKGIGVHFFPAPGEQIHFVFHGTHFWASRQRQLVGDQFYPSHLPHSEDSSSMLVKSIRSTLAGELPFIE
jgi:hypothetical protein